MKRLIAFSALAAVAAVAEDVPEFNCVSDGECQRGDLISFTYTDTTGECLQECAATPGCNVYTHYRDVTLCQLYRYCDEIEANFCDQCVTGYVVCDPTSRFDRYMVVGGYSSGRTDSVELFDLSGTHAGCEDPAPFPEEVYGAVGAYINGEVQCSNSSLTFSLLNSSVNGLIRFGSAAETPQFSTSNDVGRTTTSTTPGGRGTKSCRRGGHTQRVRAWFMRERTMRCAFVDIFLSSCYHQRGRVARYRRRKRGLSSNCGATRARSALGAFSYTHSGRRHATLPGQNRRKPHPVGGRTKLRLLHRTSMDVRVKDLPMRTYSDVVFPGMTFNVTRGGNCRPWSILARSFNAAWPDARAMTEPAPRRSL